MNDKNTYFLFFLNFFPFHILSTVSPFSLHFMSISNTSKLIADLSSLSNYCKSMHGDLYFSKVFSHSTHITSKSLLEISKSFFSFSKNNNPLGNGLFFHIFIFHNEFWWFLCVNKVDKPVYFLLVHPVKIKKMRARVHKIALPGTIFMFKT